MTQIIVNRNFFQRTHNFTSCTDRHLAEIAANQAFDLTQMQHLSEKEKTILLTTIEELQIQSEEKLIIGKLHHHILALQLSEATALRKLDSMNSKCLQLESRVVKLENKIDEHEHSIYQMRLDQKSRNRILLRSLCETRTKLAGIVFLDKFEKACDLLRTLETQKKDIQSDMEILRDDKRQIEDQLVEYQIKLESQAELMLVLKESDKNAITERISSWQKKMTEVKLEDLKLQKELKNSNLDRDSNKKSLIAAEKKLECIQEDFINMQSDHETALLDWERRQTELEEKVERPKK
ncbi:hypothetical protein HK096_005352 [Nowakowskiella sp. JEL0078]|nr:hypothetical protein HK096_005352 [Nowakowskiella sp. JEL0078]